MAKNSARPNTWIMRGCQAQKGFLELGDEDNDTYFDIPKNDNYYDESYDDDIFLLIGCPVPETPFGPGIHA